MSAPNIPGLSDYPELEQKYIAQYRKAARGRPCARCEKQKVVRRFRKILEQRQRTGA